MKKLNMIDKGFLLAESREMPMHIGGVNLFTLPDGADEHEFLHNLAHTIRDTDELITPFGDCLKVGRAGVVGNAQWEPDPALDMEYHVRHSALPKPGRYRELFTLVSRLHGTLLERSRPLWEMHLIEGLQDRQFAVYSKTHHAAVDGARSIHINRSMLSRDPQHVMDVSPLSLESWQRYKLALQSGKRDLPTEEELRNVADMLKSTYDSSANLFRAVKRFTGALAGGSSLNLPHMRVPSSVLNSSVEGARRFVAQSWPFARIHRVAKAYDGTFNDAVLAMCSGALRQYLINHAELPTQQGLKAMVPVSLRQEGDFDSGNAIAAISADLSTHIADPTKRIRAIIQSVQASKAFYRGMSPKEVELVSLLMQSPSILLTPLGLIPKLPPYNVAISNVPGIRETMYWNGARLEGSYPVSIVTDGMAMNITLVTYGDNVDFGIVACRRSLPQVQRLIDYMEDSLCELEDAAGFSAGAKKPRRTASSPAKKKVTKARVPTKA